MDVLKEKYLKNPCGTLSIPYWKNKMIKIPDNIKVIHKNEFNLADFVDYDFQSFFRLKHDLGGLQEVNDCLCIDLEKDKEELVNLINLAYKNQISVTKEDLEKWMNHPVSESLLWICIKENDRMIASGIGEYDRELKEGIIEWVQVLPDYQHQVYGKKLVNNLLNRFKVIGANFVTVSGSLNNKTNPEGLYRSCGFTGNDIWYICSN